MPGNLATIGFVGGAVAATLLMATPAPAATISRGAPPCDFTLSGDIAEGDAKRLVDAGFQEPANLPPTLCLDSDGGAFEEAILLMYAVEGFGGTAVPAGSKCLSTCALVFMAGRSRDADGYCAPNRRLSARATLRFPGLADLAQSRLAAMTDIAESACFFRSLELEVMAPCACQREESAQPLLRPSLVEVLAEAADGKLAEAPGDAGHGFTLREAWQASYLGIDVVDLGVAVGDIANAPREALLNACGNLALRVTHRRLSVWPIGDAPPGRPEEVNVFSGDQGGLDRTQPAPAAELQRLQPVDGSTLAIVVDGSSTSTHLCWTDGSHICLRTTSEDFGAGDNCLSAPNGILPPHFWLAPRDGIVLSPAAE